MQEQKRIVYLRLKHQESAELQYFLASRRHCEEARTMLQDLCAADARYKELGATILFMLELKQAIELNKMLKEKVPTAEGAWTSLHSIRMRVMEQIVEHERFIKENGCRCSIDAAQNAPARRRETIHEAEMRGLATLGIGPMLDIARSAVADFRVAFGCPRKAGHAEGRRACKGQEK